MMLRETDRKQPPWRVTRTAPMSASDSGYEADVAAPGSRAAASRGKPAAETESYFADSSDASGRRDRYDGGATDSGAMGDCSATAVEDSLRRLRKRPRSPVRTERSSAAVTTSDGRCYGTTAARTPGILMPSQLRGKPGGWRTALAPGRGAALLPAALPESARPAGWMGRSLERPSAPVVAPQAWESTAREASMPGSPRGALASRRPGGRADAPPLARAAAEAMAAAAASASASRSGQGTAAAGRGGALRLSRRRARSQRRVRAKARGTAARAAAGAVSSRAVSTLSARSAASGVSGWDADEEDAEEASASSRGDIGSDSDVSYEGDEEGAESATGAAGVESFHPEFVPDRADRAEGYEPSDASDREDD